MAIQPVHCDLCGLTCTCGDFPLVAAGRTCRFCCPGCRQVFAMLAAMSGSPDPAAFRTTDLFRRCRELGVIPAGPNEVAEAVRTQHPEGSPPPADSGMPDETTLEIGFAVRGMWCPACAWLIEESLLRQPGVLEARCHFATDRLQCRYDPVRAAPADVVALLERLGYRAVEPGEAVAARERRGEFVRFSVAAFLTMNVMMLSLALYTGFFAELTKADIRHLSWPMLVMATVVLAYGGQPVRRRGWAGILGGAPGMESLIALGADAAWLFSLVNLLRGSLHLYFDTACMLITLVLLGQLLERRAKNRIQEDLTAFFALVPGKVRVCTPQFPDGRFVAAEQLAPGVDFRVEAGEVVPADGRVLEGAGTVSEAALTGEAAPQAKGMGDRLMSGARVESGAYRVRAERVGAASTLGQMVAVMERALGRRSPLEGRTERLLRWFVPGILALALGTAMVCLAGGADLEAAFTRGLTVLVISCPCALGMAIPLARVAGLGLCRRRGILVRTFHCFDTAARLKTVVFDKTGTLTTGRWSLQAIRPAPGWGEERFLALAAGLEQDDEHPIAREIRAAAAARGIVPSLCEDRVGHGNGWTGRWQDQPARIGSRGLLTDWLAETSGSGEGETRAGGMDGLVSRVYLGVAGCAAGVLEFGDRLKPGAGEAVEALRALGLEVALVSGDGPEPTGEAARRLGIERWRAEQPPEAKAALMEAWRPSGGALAMVGDGVNDAAALAAADLGIAVHAGNPLGREAADLTLMRGDPRQLVDFLALSGRVQRTIGQNFFFSLAYNAVGIPLAMSGLLNPLVAVTAMLLSSLSVTGNTLRLVRRGSAPGA
jgi:heavy metal translocating P-type ATPase